MIEVFKDVPGYEELYQVSNLGNVKSLITGKILSPGINTCGYLHVILCKNGKQKYYLIHRLVAQAFIPNPDNYPEVNHKDKNRQNNCVDNLEWCTTQYNVEYSRAKQVAQYDLNGNLIATWKSVREIERQTGFLQGSISDCCRGHRNCKTMYGYIWRYI